MTITPEGLREWEAKITAGSELVHDLRTEADLCRNEGADDISVLLDDAASSLIACGAIANASKEAHAAALERLAALTIDRDNYAAKYANMRERAERAEVEIAALLAKLVEAELARLKAPVEVAGIVAEQRRLISSTGGEIANPTQSATVSALESLAAQLAERDAENSKLRSALAIVHFKREPWQ